MTTVIIPACLFFAAILLLVLSVIDLRTRLLPNKYVGGFLVLGIIFHVVSDFYFTPVQDAVLGGLAGGGLLYAIRFFANKMYKRDTLGLGDVKLMGAAGVWLGTQYIFLALCVGAFAGLVHGVFYAIYLRQKTGEAVKFSTLSIPAGPGFIVGIVIAAILLLEDLPHFLLDF